MAELLSPAARAALNLNEDEGGGGPSEDEYDALNDETFGGDGSEFDWEEEHEQLAQITETSRRQKDEHLDLEASLSKLVLDDGDAPMFKASGSTAPWPHLPAAPHSASAVKKVCTVEELERQLRQKQTQQNQQMQPNQNYFQPRFPVILQRPPGLHAPVPLPFAPQQPMNQMNQQPLQQLLQGNQMGQTSNQIGPNPNQMGPNTNQMGPNTNQMGPNTNQMGPNTNQMVPNPNKMGPNLNQMGSNLNQMGPNSNQMGQTSNQIGPNPNQMGPNSNQMGPNPNQMGLNTNQMGPNSNQMMNGNPFGSGQMGPNQMPMMPPHMMGQRMLGPPPGLSNVPRHFSPNMGQFNPNFCGPMDPQLNKQQNLMMNQQMMNQPQVLNQQILNPNQHLNQPQMMNQSPSVQQLFQSQQQINQQNNQSMNQQNMNQPMSQQNMNQTISQQSMNQPMSQQSMNQPMSQQNMSQPMNQQNMNQPINQQNMNQAMSQQNMNQPMTQQMNQINQSQQNPMQIMNQNQLKTNRKNQKSPPKNAQRSLIFNNSNQKNLSSQNLVQMIQNTHPMLQMHNNSYHNASHHPVLNIRTNVFSNQSNHPMFNNQRGNNGNRYMNGDDNFHASDGYHNNDGFHNNEGYHGNGNPRRDSSDEYAGLMSQREKHWLLNIQMIQLNTGTPYVDDFYYTVFLDRQSKKEKEGVKEAHKANQQNHPFYSGNKESAGRERHNSGRHNSTSEDQPAPRTYVPTQFENSLGKLQCGSVTAPRKIIDVDVVQNEPGSCGSARQSRAPSVASTTHPHEGPREVRRTKQFLLDIEALYLVLLRLEELNDPLAISNAVILKEREEKARLAECERMEGDTSEQDSNLFLRNIESVQRRPASQDIDKTLDKRQVVSLSTSEPAKSQTKNLLDENKDELISKIFAGLLFEERLPMYCGIRKGKTLIQRFLARVPASHPRLRTLWARILRALPAAARRDARDDNVLPKFTPAFRKYISNSTGWAAILEACAHISEVLDPARPPHALVTPFTLSCVTILMEKASTLINTTEATSNERQWTKFLKSLARTLKHVHPSVTVAKPTKPMVQSDVQCHIKLLESKATVEILKRGKTAPEFADLSKNEFSEILVKHLC